MCHSNAKLFWVLILLFNSRFLLHARNAGVATSFLPREEVQHPQIVRIVRRLTTCQSRQQSRNPN